MHRDDDDQSQPHHGKAHYEIAHGSARQPPLVEDDGQPLSEDSGSQRLPHLRVLRVEQKQGGLWVPIGPSHSLGKAYSRTSVTISLRWGPEATDQEVLQGLVFLDKVALQQLPKPT